MADKYFVGTDGDWGTAGNWSPSGVPVAADNVHFTYSSGNVTTSLDQSGVALGDFIVDEGCTATFGSIPSTGDAPTYLQIDPNYFLFNGSGDAAIDLGAAAIDVDVRSTSTPAGAGASGLYLIGTGINDLTIHDGTVGLAQFHGEAATAEKIIVSKSTAKLYMGSGVTASPDVRVYYGDVEIHCDIDQLQQHGGNVITLEQGTIATCELTGGRFTGNSTGTITALHLHGGLADFTKSTSDRTITQLKCWRGVLYWDDAYINITSRAASPFGLVEYHVPLSDLKETTTVSVTLESFDG